MFWDVPVFRNKLCIAELANATEGTQIIMIIIIMIIMIIIDDNYESSTYNWDHGTHYNTREEDGCLVLDLPTYDG